jgi:hypothetical protein
MISAQRSKSLADGVAHQLELRAVAREAKRVGLGAVKRRGYAGDEHRVIAQPAVHL